MPRQALGEQGGTRKKKAGEKEKHQLVSTGGSQAERETGLTRDILLGNEQLVLCSTECHLI